MTASQPLFSFGRGLLAIRDTFHKTGRLDDSNAKLDEIVKLVALELAQIHYPNSRVPSLSEILNRSKNSPRFPLLSELNKYLVEASKLPIFTNDDGESLFGSAPVFALSDSEKSLAEELIALVLETLNGHLRNGSIEEFDLLNESFGHFVRDNFRNNIEDAQYMTPPEVVSYMCQLGLAAIETSHEKGDLIVADPSCGVGSFLAQFYRSFLRSGLSKKAKILLVGQDKVDRMTRFSRINLLLYGISKARITRGNSLLGDSPLSQFAEKCDLILTNPPFGARFRTTEIRDSASSDGYPLLGNLIRRTDTVLDSELLFVDRYLWLLKPGGVALAVVPDGVVSAKGAAETLRRRLEESCEIRSITSLPAVTFAQAGTRTKTCILHIQKIATKNATSVFIADARSIGFEVSSRKGVPVKKSEGENELLKVTEAFKRFEKLNGINEPKILSRKPSCVAIPKRVLLQHSWTPGHHSADRYEIVNKLNRVGFESEFELCELRNLVSFPNRSQKIVRNNISNGTKCISVLHVGNFGYLDVQELMSYKPKYPGQPCSSGDLLFSKINPRIPRVLVVPELGYKLQCSTEFEVMRSNGKLSSYSLMLLLLSPIVQTQVQSLTSGTSSSHNRIRSEQLERIVIPIPAPRSKSEKALRRVIAKFEESAQTLNNAAVQLTECMQHLTGLYRSATDSQDFTDTRFHDVRAKGTG